MSPAKAAHTCRLSGAPQPCLEKYSTPLPPCPKMQAPALGRASAFLPESPERETGQRPESAMWQVLEADNSFSPLVGQPSTDPCCVPRQEVTDEFNGELENV